MSDGSWRPITNMVGIPVTEKRPRSSEGDIKRQFPDGELTRARDFHGNPLTGSDGKPLFIRERSDPQPDPRER
jgi:hypothetical protein